MSHVLTLLYECITHLETCLAHVLTLLYECITHLETYLAHVLALLYDYCNVHVYNVQRSFYTLGDRCALVTVYDSVPPSNSLMFLQVYNSTSKLLQDVS